MCAALKELWPILFTTKLPTIYLIYVTHVNGPRIFPDDTNWALANALSILNDITVEDHQRVKENTTEAVEAIIGAEDDE